jgi:hypothetical protein
LRHAYASANSAVSACEFSRSDRQWTERAINDRLSGENTGLWAQLSTQRGEPDQLLSMLSSIRNARYHVELAIPIGPESVGIARNWLSVGRPLLKHLTGGGSLGKLITPRVVKDAQPLLTAVRVDGRVPDDKERLSAALDQINAEISAIQLAETWQRAGVPVRAMAGQPDLTLSSLANQARLFGAIDDIEVSRDTTARVLAQAGISAPLHNLGGLGRLLGSVAQASLLQTLAAKRAEIQQLQNSLTALSTATSASPEVAELISAVAQHNPS